MPNPNPTTGDSSTPRKSRSLVLKSRPKGRVVNGDFAWQEQDLPALGAGEVLVETLYLSVDPTNRIWMSDQPAYLPPVALGSVMRAAGLGRVLASSHPGMAPGDLVAGLLGWQDFLVSPGVALSRVQAQPGVPLSLYLGALGMTGLTAWVGMNDIGKPRAGETVVVSAAAGAVGSIAGQLARLAGARVVGLAGSPDKCAWLKSVAGFDEAIDYHQHKGPALGEALHKACPKGIDVYFENVGGSTLEAILPLLNNGARIPLCGLISQYNEREPVRGPLGFEQLLMKRVMLQGFIILDFAPRFGEALAQLAPLVLGGKIQFQETILKGGLERMVEAVNMLFDGKNQGKLLVQISDVR